MVEQTEVGPALPTELIDHLAAQIRTPAEFRAIYRQSQKALTERVLTADPTHHLCYSKGGARPPDGNARNGTTP